MRGPAVEKFSRILKALRALSPATADDDNPNNSWKPPKWALVSLWSVQVILPVIFLVGLPFVAMNKVYGYYPPRNAPPTMDGQSWLIMTFSLLCLIMTSTEIYLFTKRKLGTRAYFISMWAKACLVVLCWGLISVFRWTATPRRGYVPAAYYSYENFLFQHPAIVLALCYAIWIHLKQGGKDVGITPISLMDREDTDTEPLLTTISEDV